MNVHGRRRVERYLMDRQWSLHVYRWSGSLEMDGRVFPVRPGHASVEPPNTPLVWRYDMEECPHHYVHFALPEAARSELVEIPVMQDLGASFAEVSEEMERLVGLFASHRARAEIRLWDLLLRLSRPAPTTATTPGDLPFAVQTAIAIVENELRDRLDVSMLCRRIAISPNHLTRLFQRCFGTGVAEWIRQRRVDKARHLLEQSNLPIKAIAAEVGVPDLQRFNKLVRKLTGQAPSALRKRRSA